MLLRSGPPHVGLLPGEDRAGMGVVYVADMIVLNYKQTCVLNGYQ